MRSTAATATTITRHGGRGGRRSLSRRLVATGVVAAVAIGGLAFVGQASAFVYTANFFSWDVSLFSQGPSGSLAPLVPARFAVATPVNFGGPSQVIFSPDGNSAYVPTRGADQLLYEYDVAANGTLSPKSTATIALTTPDTATTFSFFDAIAFSPNGRAAYVTAGHFACDASGCVDSPGTISQFDIGADGELRLARTPTVPTGADPGAIQVGPDGRSVYVVDAVNSVVRQYDVGLLGTLSAKRPATVPTDLAPQRIRLSPDGRSAYFVSQAQSAGVPPAEQFQFTVSQYDVARNGALTPKRTPTITVPGIPDDIAISAGSASAYVESTGTADPATSGVYEYDVRPDGSLAPKSTPSINTIGAYGASGIALSVDGRSVYVANSTNSVSQFDVGPSGLLSLKSPPFVAFDDDPATDQLPVGIAVNQVATQLAGGPLVLKRVPGSTTLQATVSATLRAGFAHTPQAGKTLTFSVAGRTLCSAITDASGRAACAFNGAPVVAAAVRYTVAFAGDNDYRPASANGGVVATL